MNHCWHFTKGWHSGNGGYSPIYSCCWCGIAQGVPNKHGSHVTLDYLPTDADLPNVVEACPTRIPVDGGVKVTVEDVKLA